MSIENIIKNISEYGIMIIICGVFLYSVIKLINMLFDYFSPGKSRKERLEHDQRLEVRQSVGIKAQSLIDDFLEKHDLDRIHIIEFSNSIMSVAYLPFKYMSCTYEVYKVGSYPTANKIDHLSTSLFTKFFSILYDREEIILDYERPDMNIEGATYDLMKSTGKSKCLFNILKSSKGKVLGYICISNEAGFNDAVIDEALILANKISALLGVLDK